MREAKVAEGARKATGTARAIVEIRGLRKVYHRDRQELVVLDGIDLDIPEGSFEALMGPSGSGKTTLLNLIAGIDQPTAGTVHVGGEDIGRMSEGARAAWRSRNIGFIFQFYNLMPVLTAAENVELPLLLAPLSKAERKRRVELALKLVDLSDRADHTPRQLSGGQQQRVAIARAIVADPQIIVADEPTGDLDRKSAEDVLGLLTTLNETLGKTVVMVTHDPHAAERAKIQRRLDKGQLT
ncbi:MAG TPA: ABC transporter ATP-binding protein [Myxococcales bacterium]|nr:ABC transporter ATP-binding protein [Myxococcales bacterium]